MHTDSFIFFGSPQFAEYILTDIIAYGMIPTAVVCSPDKPTGRKHILTPPPVKILAHQHHIPVIQPEKKPHVSDIQQFTNTSYALVAAYAHIIPHETIASFSRGVIGVHPSLLPAYRGPSPIQSVLLDGLSMTGISLYRIDEEMDHGPILIQESVAIDAHDTYQSLEEKLAHTGARLITQSIPRWIDTSLVSVEQDHTSATYTRKFTTEDGFVDIEKDSGELIARKIHSLSPDPGVFTFIHGVRTKLCTVIYSDHSWIVTEIIPAGKRKQLARIQLI